MASALATLMARTSLLVPNPPTAPYTDPYLTANLVCRVVLALFANAVCCVPLGNLCRQGELAPVVLIGTVVAANCLTVVNALVWRNDNVYEWWDGRVWCDLHAYLYQPLMPLYWLSVVAITRNLAQQLGLSRASPLSRRERRRKTLVEALVVFPLPILQMGLLYPISSQRYRIVTLTGCMWTAHPSWPFFVFFLLPRPVVVLMSSYYAVLTWRRYSLIAQATRPALMSNSSATSRASRTQWRLFLVTACVLVPYMPLELYMTAAQFRTDMLSRGFDFHRIRQQVDDPFPWDTILLLPSGSLSFLELNHQYLTIATALPIFYFFGMTTDTMRTYRRVMRALGFGKVFPRLREGSAASGHTEQQPEAPWQEQIVLTPMKSAGDDGSQICPCDLEDITKPRSDWHHDHSQGPSNASDSSCPHNRAIMDSQSAIALPAKAHVYARSG
ncbi:pheromone receptor [Colletotrichum tabaci]|uniref:Pheromone receptor n=1 Tax=Colletotrichum tabaci TaxID=1209068 RepID=A0AAV9SZD0_9PEZI